MTPLLHWGYSFLREGGSANERSQTIAKRPLRWCRNKIAGPRRFLFTRSGGVSFGRDRSTDTRGLKLGHQRKNPVRSRSRWRPMRSHRSTGRDSPPLARPAPDSQALAIGRGLNHSAAGAYSWDEKETQISLKNDQGRSLDRCRKYWIWPRLACREFCDRGRG